MAERLSSGLGAAFALVQRNEYKQRLVWRLSFHRHFPLALARSETLQLAEGKHLDRGPSLTRDLRLKGRAKQPQNGTPLGNKYQLPENPKSSRPPMNPTETANCTQALTLRG